jgi:hypothetical protein
MTRLCLFYSCFLPVFAQQSLAFVSSPRYSSVPTNAIESLPPLARSSRLFLSPAEAWSAYNSALESSPLIVKSITACVILGAADLTGQAVENSRREDKQEVDWARAARFAFFGLVLQAPWNHFYYQVLDSQIPPTPEPFTTTNGVKVFIDQFLQAPVFTALIFIFLGVLEGKQSEEIQKQFKNDYKETILANCKYRRWDETYLSIVQ